MRGPSRLELLAEFFRERPGIWHDGRDLARLGGAYAWRTRLSELRMAPYSMNIENRQRRVPPNGGQPSFTVSEYRLMPMQTTGASPALVATRPTP